MLIFQGLVFCFHGETPHTFLLRPDAETKHTMGHLHLHCLSKLEITHSFKGIRTSTWSPVCLQAFLKLITSGNGSGGGRGAELVQPDSSAQTKPNQTAVPLTCMCLDSSAFQSEAAIVEVKSWHALRLSGAPLAPCFSLWKRDLSISNVEVSLHSDTRIYVHALSLERELEPQGTTHKHIQLVQVHH